MYRGCGVLAVGIVTRSFRKVHWQPRLAPGPEAAVNIGRVGEAQLLQRRGCPARLITLIAQENDGLVEVRRLRMAMLAGRIQPPFQDVAAITSAPAIVPSRAICESERMSISAAPERIAARA